MVEDKNDKNVPCYTTGYLKGQEITDHIVGMWFSSITAYKIGDKLYKPEDVTIIRESHQRLIWPGVSDDWDKTWEEYWKKIPKET